ncbi:MAG: hypothetical protein WBJ13_08850 [Sedimentibacter sp.]
MYHNINDSPLDKNLLNNKLIVCDIVYNPRKTKLLYDAEKIGCKIVMGLSMLVYQGSEAFELWTNSKAPEELMFKTVEKEFN